MSIENYIQAWVKSGDVSSVGFSSRTPADSIICKDGFKFSVQASANHYCTPRNDDASVGGDRVSDRQAWRRIN